MPFSVLGWVLATAVVGLFVGAAVWVVGRALAEDRPLRAMGSRMTWTATLPVVVRLPLARLGWALRSTDDLLVPRLLFELAVAVYLGIAAWNLGSSLALVAAVIFALPLLTILLVDWWTRYIYTSVVVAGTLAGLAVALTRGPGALAGSVLAALLAGLVFAAGYIVAGILFGDDEEAPFGLGDVYVAVMIGAMAGFPGVVRALFAGVFLAAALSLLLLIRRRDRHDTIPYGSFLCLGALLTFLQPG